MLEQNLKCPICLSIAEDPWESSCCGHLFCNQCIKLIKSKKCPICRKKRAKFRENTFAKKFLLNDLLVKCQYGCDASITLGNTKLHRYECELSLFKCSIKTNNIQCTFEGVKQASLQHFIEKHCDQVILLAEHYPSVKNTYDKNTIIEKYNKNLSNQKELTKRDLFDKLAQEVNKNDSNNSISSIVNKILKNEVNFHTDAEYIFNRGIFHNK